MDRDPLPPGSTPSPDDPPACCSVYVTCGSLDDARRLADALLERRLVACVNLVPGVVSLYRWQGATTEDAEVLMFCKTRAARVPEVLAAVAELHPYEEPCAVALPLTDGLPGYLRWVAAETTGEAGGAAADGS